MLILHGTFSLLHFLTNMKNNKGTKFLKNPFFLIVILAALGIFIYFGFFSRASVFNGAGQGWSKNVEIISTSQNYYIYKLTANPHDVQYSNSGGCTSEPNIDETITFTSNGDDLINSNSNLIFQLPDDIYLGKEFTTENIKFNGLSIMTGACSDSKQNPTPQYKNLVATCKANSREKISCRITGEIYSASGNSFKIYGTNSIILEIEIPRVVEEDEIEEIIEEETNSNSEEETNAVNEVSSQEKPSNLVEWFFYYLNKFFGWDKK